MWRGVAGVEGCGRHGGVWQVWRGVAGVQGVASVEGVRGAPTVLARGFTRAMNSSHRDTT